MFRYLPLLFLSLSLHAQSNFDADVFKPAFSDLYHFRFDEADKKIELLKSLECGELHFHFMKTNVLWWRFLAAENNTYLADSWLYHANVALDKIRYCPSLCTNDSLFLSISLNAFKARILLLDKSYYKAYKQANKLVECISRSRGKENEFPFFYLSSGIYNYGIEKAKSNSFIMLPYLITLPKGNLKLGLEQLTKGSESNNLNIRVESHYFLLKFYLEEEKDYEKALVSANFLTKHFPENVFYCSLAMHVYQKLGKQDKINSLYAQASKHMHNNKSLKKESVSYYNQLLKSFL